MVFLCMNTKLWLAKRSFSTTAVIFGRRGRVPYDKRNWPTTDRDIGEHTERSNKEWNVEYAKQFRKQAHKYGLGPQPQGYYKADGTLVKVPEMIPEFIVPDLTDCKLKPYVPYSTSEVVQSEFTAKDLFDATYGQKAAELFKKRKLELDTVNEFIDSYKDKQKDPES